ncbi:MAG: sugar phosphate isomerase/epimerase [Peptococcaceae bacterium]|nr:sugar phosphate isomerase/epimerase [Peptococcaceae bacterium]
MDVIDALKNIKAYGYDGVELTLNDSHLHPLKHGRDRIARIKNYCLENNIDIACVAAGGDRLLSQEPYEPSLISPEKEGRIMRIDLIKRSMEIANYLEAPVLNINSGKLQKGVNPEQAFEYIYTNIESLLKEQSGLILVIEPEPGFFIGTSADAVNLIQQINNSRFRLNLDIGHVFCCEEDCYSAIEKAMPYTRHIHIEDIKNKIHHHEIPGEGDIDFDKVFKIIRSSNYNHYISVELHHHADMWERALKESIEYLAKFI